MRYEVAKALAVSVIALAAPPAMARPATAATPAPPDTPTDTPTDRPTDTDTPTSTTPAPQDARTCSPFDDPDFVAGSGPVPRVVGMTRDNAKAELKLAGFDTEARPPGAAADWIVSKQTPTSEKLATCGSTVTIDLEAPPCPPYRDPDIVVRRDGPVPGVVGMTRDNAKDELERGGFGMKAMPSDAAGDWIVRAQRPSGTASCGSTVTINLEVPTVEVPDVVDDPLEQAERKIRDQGLVSSVTEGEAADPRVVASQDPAAGTRAPKGSTVTLHLHPVTPPGLVLVPDLRGLTRRAASKRLHKRGLRLVVSSGDSGRVSLQEPAADSLVKRGTSVAVVLTVDTTPTASPDPSKTDYSSSTEPPVWLVAVATVAAMAAVASWAVRRARRGSRPAPAASVVCVPCADPSPGVEVRDFAPTVGVTFVCHHDQGRQEIREIVR